MRIAVALIMALHGIVHAIGFASAFKLGPRIEFRHSISPSWGVAWLITGCAWVATALLYAVRMESQSVLGATASVASFALIARNFHEAKWGLLPNVLLTFPIVMS